MKRLLPALVLIVPALSIAQEANIELTPFVGARFGGTFESELPGAEPVEYEMEDSESFGLIVNWRHRANTQWEVLYSLQSSEALYFGPDDPNGPDPEVDVDIHVLQLGGTYLFEGERAIPYLAATVGGTHIRTNSTDAQDDTFLSGSIGLGVKILPTSRVGVRLEARAYGTLLDSDSRIFCSTGPDQNICAVQVDGNLLSQVEVFAGLTFRF
jgi:hypothetical protein